MCFNKATPKHSMTMMHNKIHTQCVTKCSLINISISWLTPPLKCYSEILQSKWKKSLEPQAWLEQWMQLAIGIKSDPYTWILAIGYDMNVSNWDKFNHSDA